MKYFCRKCGTVLEIGEGVSTEEFFEDGLFCWFCGETHPLCRIPDHETVEQREERTGKPVSDNTAVFQYRGLWQRDNNKGVDTVVGWHWETKTLSQAKHTASAGYPTKDIVIADPPTPPDWKPDTEEKNN